MAYLRIALSGMHNYSLTPQGPASAKVKYNPTNPLMGSATLEVNAEPVVGMNNKGKRVTGTELVYTDTTGFFSQDTSFSGSDIIDRVKSSVANVMKFKGVACEQVRRQ